MPPAALFIWRVRWIACPGGALSGTVLNWGDAYYAGVSSRVQLGAPNPSECNLVVLGEDGWVLLVGAGRVGGCLEAAR